MSAYAISFTAEVLCLVVIGPDRPEFQRMFQIEARSWEKRDAAGSLSTRAEVRDAGDGMQFTVFLSEPAGGRYDIEYPFALGEVGAARMRKYERAHEYVALVRTDQELRLLAEGIQNGRPPAVGTAIFAKLERK